MQNDVRISPNYVCPRTHAPLHLDGDALRAAEGDGVYPIQAGIPQFLRFEPVEDIQTRAKIALLNRLARETGWQSALHVVHGADPAFIRYVTDIERASFIDLLPLTREGDVLEIGPGLGQFTTLLARGEVGLCPGCGGGSSGVRGRTLPPGRRDQRILRSRGRRLPIALRRRGLRIGCPESRL